MCIICVAGTLFLRCSAVIELIISTGLLFSTPTTGVYVNLIALYKSTFTYFQQTADKRKGTLIYTTYYTLTHITHVLRVIGRHDKSTFLILYTSYIRPYLEYSRLSKHGHHASRSILVQVQRRAMKPINRRRLRLCLLRLFQVTRN